MLTNWISFAHVKDSGTVIGLELDEVRVNSGFHARISVSNSMWRLDSDTERNGVFGVCYAHVF